MTPEEKTRKEVDQIISAMRQKGYTVFSDGSRDFNLNIVGIRTVPGTVNQFDDWMYVFFPNSMGEYTSFKYPITTDPGLYHMMNPVKGGTAILVPGQYSRAWKIGYHRGEYEALVQKKAVSVYRDDDRDTEHDMNAWNIKSGVFGINIHRSNPYTQSEKVDKWSAGCQVFKVEKDFSHFMWLCKQSATIYGSSFTYTLLKSDEVWF